MQDSLGRVEAFPGSISERDQGCFPEPWPWPWPPYFMEISVSPKESEGQS